MMFVLVDKRKSRFKNMFFCFVFFKKAAYLLLLIFNQMKLLTEKNLVDLEQLREFIYNLNLLNAGKNECLFDERKQKHVYYEEIQLVEQFLYHRTKTILIRNGLFAIDIRYSGHFCRQTQLHLHSYCAVKQSPHPGFVVGTFLLSEFLFDLF